MMLSSLIVSVMILTSPKHSEQIIWKANIYSHQITWTTSSLQIQAPNSSEPVYLCRDEHQSKKDRGVVNLNEGDVWDDHSLLSVVGPYVSIQEESYLLQGDGTGSSGSNDFVTFDLSNHGKPADLRKIFSDEILFSALIKDSIVLDALKQGNVSKPASLQGLLDVLPKIDYEMQKFDENLFQHFAFHHLEGDNVAIRLTGWKGGCGAMHSALTILGILLPIPNHLRPALTNASLLKEGFLLKDRKKISRGLSTHY